MNTSNPEWVLARGISVTKRAVYSDEAGGRGNCLAACLATLLEIPLGNTRGFHENYLAAAVMWEQMSTEARADHIFISGETLWQEELTSFLNAHHKVAAYPLMRHASLRPAGWSIALGESKNGGRHACVAFDGELVHDPNPRKVRGAADWGLRSIEHYVVLLKGAE